MSRNYKKEWELGRPWLKLSSDGSGDAFCTVCNRSMSARLDTIKKHSEGKGHIAREDNKLKQKDSVMQMFKSKESGETNTKRAEIELSAAIACHCSIRTIDHLSEIIVKHGVKSTLERIKLHRTKCSAIIKSVIGPSLLESMREDMRNERYSIIVDESTDVGCVKLLAVCVKYFSKKQNKIVTKFLGLVPVTETTGEVLFHTLCEFLAENDLNITNCIGIGTDGAANLCGKNNSVFSRFKQENPHMQLVKCICHSLHHCSEHSFDEMPSNLGFVLQEVPSWFSRSAVRQEAYLNVFKTFNADKPNRKHKKFMTVSTTRWLSRSSAAAIILDEWYELKSYFNSIMMANEKSFTARLLRDIFNDEASYLYFEFLVPILKEFETTNLLFQRSDEDPYKLFEALTALYKSMCARICNQTVDYNWDFQSHLKTVSSCIYGMAFTNALQASFLNPDQKYGKFKVI